MSLSFAAENRKVAEYQHNCAYKVARQLQRRDQVQQTTAFVVWQQYSQRCQQMRAGLQQLVSRATHAKLARTFAAWSRCASASAGNVFVQRCQTTHQIQPGTLAVSDVRQRTHLL